MHRWQLFALAVLCLALTGFIYPEDQGAVTDSADLLSTPAERELITELTSLRNQIGTYVQVVTVTEDQVGTEALGPYSRELFAAWQSHFSSNARRVVILVAASRPGFRISVSRALRGTFDEATLHQISEELLPSFQRGEWQALIFRGVRAIERQIKPDFRPTNTIVVATNVPARSNEDSSDIMIVGYIGLAIIGLLALFVILIRKQGSSRGRSSRGGFISSNTVGALSDLGEATGEIAGRAAASAAKSLVENLGNDGNLGGDSGCDGDGGGDFWGGDGSD